MSIKKQSTGNLNSFGMNSKPIMASNYKIELSIPNLDDVVVNMLCNCLHSITYDLSNKITECTFTHLLDINIEQVIESISINGIEQLIITPKENITSSKSELFIACLFGKCLKHNCEYNIEQNDLIKHYFKFEFYTINHINKNTIFNHDSIIGRLLNSLKELYILQNC